MIVLLRRLLPLLLLLGLGVAAAQDASKLPECILTPGTTAATPDGSNLTLTAFLPNAPCNMAQIMYLWGYWGLWKGIAFVGMGLTTAFFFWSLFRAVLSKTPEKALIPFLTALVLVGFISPATKGEGVIPMVQSTGVEWFNALYRTSADVGYAAMSRGENSVQAQTAALGRNLALLVARAQHASTIRSQMAQIKAGKITGDLADPNLANTLYADQIRNEQAGADSLISNRGWIFNVGYWLLFGLFSIFAGIIVVVGGTMQLMLLLLPVALAFLVLGQFKPVTAIGASYLSALLTIGVLPVIVATIASITLGIPAAKMLPVVTQMNGDLSAQLTRYQELLRNGCQWYEVSCNFEAQVFNPILSDLTTIKELFITLVVVVLSGIVGLSIGATFIRRVPAAIAGVFGASGGGESSGVETGGIGKLLAMTGGMKMLQQLTRTPGANASSAGPKTDGSPAPSPGPALPPGGGGGQYTPPESVTAGSGSSTTSTSGNIPPESVTSGASGNPRTVVGASYAAFQGSRGAGVPFGQAVQAGVQPMFAGAAAGVRAHGQTIRQDYGAAAQRGRENLTRTASNLAFGSANAERGRAAVSAAVQDFRDTNAQVRAQDTTQNRSVNPDEFETRSRRDPVAAVQNAAQAQSHFTVTPEQRAGEQGARPASRAELSGRNQGGSLQDWTAAPAPVRPPKLGPPPPRPVSPTEQEAQSHKTRMAQGTGPTLADMDATRRNTLALGGPQGKAIPGVFPGPLEPRPAAPAPTPPLPPPPARRTERAPDEQWQASHRPVADWQPPQKPLPPPPPRVTPPPLDIPLSHLMKPAPTPPDEENPKP